MTDGDDPADPTTLHVRRARAGDAASLAWVIERFTPLLIAQARYRLGSRLAARVAPEDVVQDVWAIAIPRLAELALRAGRATPVLLRFLGTSVLLRVNDLLRRHAHGMAELDGSRPFDALPEDTRGPVSRAVHGESRALVLAAIEALDERDRALVVLRAIEQRGNAEAAELLGMAPNTAAQAYRRALDRLKERLANSAFDDLEEDSA
jgi:RNA polymerase sigma factor (sigma-70 family)